MAKKKRGALYQHTVSLTPQQEERVKALSSAHVGPGGLPKAWTTLFREIVDAGLTELEKRSA